MLPETELSFFTKILHNFGIPVHRYPLSAPVEIDQGLGRITGICDGLGHIFWDIRSNSIYSVVDAFDLHYLCFLLPESSDVFMIGPYLCRELKQQDIIVLMERHNLMPELVSAMMRYYQGIHLIENEAQLMPLLNAFGECLWGSAENFSIERIENGLMLGERLIGEPPLIEKMVDAAEFEILEARYAGERELMYAVSQGLSHRAQMIITQASERILEQRTNDPLRNLKNYGVVLNTLLRKSVED